MSKSHQHEAQNVHSASVCSKVKIAIAISFYKPGSPALQEDSLPSEPPGKPHEGAHEMIQQ